MRRRKAEGLVRTGEQLAAVLATDATHARTTVSMLLDGRDDHANRSIARLGAAGERTFADLFTRVIVPLILGMASPRRLNRVYLEGPLAA